MFYSAQLSKVPLILALKDVAGGSLMSNTNSRCIHMSCCLSKGRANANVPLRQAKMLKKLMIGSNRSRKKFFSIDQPISASFTELGTSVKGVSGVPVKSKKVLRRVEVFNTLFMEQISSLMSTGEASQEVLGLGLTITKVKISKDLSGVNVYWAATGTEQDDIIEPILSRAAGTLRRELSQLRIMGMVPPIEFVKDKTVSKIAEVEYLLGKCDFGEDFETTTDADELFSQSVSGSKIKDKFSDDFDFADDAIKISPDTAELTEKSASDEITTEAELYQSIPAMRQDILGVRHSLIMENIKDIMGKIKNRSKIQGSQENSEIDHVAIYDTGVKNTQEQIAATKQRQQEFFKYLKKRQLEKVKLWKQLSVEAKEKEFYDDEAFDRWKQQIYGKQFDIYEDHDFEDELDEDFQSSNNKFN